MFTRSPRRCVISRTMRPDVGELAHLAKKFVEFDVGQRRIGLVEQEDARVASHSARDLGALLHGERTSPSSRSRTAPRPIASMSRDRRRSASATRRRCFRAQRPCFRRRSDSETVAAPDARRDATSLSWLGDHGRPSERQGCRRRALFAADDANQRRLSRRRSGRRRREFLPGIYRDRARPARRCRRSAWLAWRFECLTSRRRHTRPCAGWSGKGRAPRRRW